MRPVLAYIVMVLIFISSDAIWLTLSGPYYHAVLKPVLGDTVVVTPAILFYVIYLFGVGVFCVAPSLGQSWRVALWRGALFGFVAYATYDMTNYATLKGWTAQITLMDLSWGSFLTASATICAVLAGGSRGQEAASRR
jgi:uncharacterized membrane protein